MVDEWAHHLYNLERKAEKTDKTFDEWLKIQDWDDEEKYSTLFEKVYDQKPQRRNYIEECVKESRPSWGYIYLSNIIMNKYFNVVLTTNFDDLLNEGSTLYPDFKPLVCAHDSAISDVRVTSARPKIIKLHGDFLYDNIKNTIRETEALDKNMRDKFIQFAKEYGLIVVGYGGNDRSIMDILDMMIRSEENYFPHGLYWCIRDENDVSKKVQKLLRRENTYWVKIEGFDDFMAELHEKLNLKLPNSISNPYEATTEWLNRFVSPKREMNHPIIKKDINEIIKYIDQFQKLFKDNLSSKDSDPYIPYEFLGDTNYNENLFEPAISYYQKEIEKDPNNLRVIEKIFNSLFNLRLFDNALRCIEKLIRLKPNEFIYKYYKMRLLEYINIDDAIKFSLDVLNSLKENSDKIMVMVALSNDYLMKNEYEDALKYADMVLSINPFSSASLINKCIALKKLGRQNEINDILENLPANLKGDYYNNACYFALINQKENMIKELKKAIKRTFRNKLQASIDPDFEQYRDDIDFKKILE